MQRRLVLDNKQYAKVYKLNLKYLKKLEDSATGWENLSGQAGGFRRQDGRAARLRWSGWNGDIGTACPVPAGRTNPAVPEQDGLRWATNRR